MNNIHRLPEERQGLQELSMQNYWVDLTLRGRKSDTVVEKGSLPPLQRTGTHLHQLHVQIDVIWQVAAAPFTTLARFGPIPLFCSRT